MSLKDHYLCYITSGILEIVYDLRIKKLLCSASASLLSTSTSMHHYYQPITIINTSLLSTHHYYQRITIINASLLSTHHYYQHQHVAVTYQCVISWQGIVIRRVRASCYYHQCASASPVIMYYIFEPPFPPFTISIWSGKRMR